MALKDALTSVGIAVSLALGLLNFATTRSIRRGTIALEEFRDQLRDPIISRLEELSKIREQLVALRKPNGLKIVELRSRVADQVASTEFQLQELEASFLAADTSTFAIASDWLSTFSPAMDKANAWASKLASPKADAKSIEAGLMQLEAELIKLDRSTRSKLGREVELRLPSITTTSWAISVLLILIVFLLLYINLR